MVVLDNKNLPLLAGFDPIRDATHTRLFLFSPLSCLLPTFQTAICFVIHLAIRSGTWIVRHIIPQSLPSAVQFPISTRLGSSATRSIANQTV